MSALGREPDYWYWGHEHLGITYSKKSAAGAFTKVRCSGHGGVPKRVPSALVDQHKDLITNTIDFLETKTPPHPSATDQMVNGFALIKFSGNTVSEYFYDENNQLSWSIVSD